MRLQVTDYKLRRRGMPDVPRDEAEVHDAETVTQHYISQHDEQPTLLYMYMGIHVSIIYMNRGQDMIYYSQHRKYEVGFCRKNVCMPIIMSVFRPRDQHDFLTLVSISL